MTGKIIVRKATMKDAAAIRDLVNGFADEGRMLHLSLNQIYERIRDFWVVQTGRRVVACAALRATWKDLGEIRSLAVSPVHQEKGLARKLLEEIFREAGELRLKELFVLTYVPGFFRKFGFSKISKSKLPHKIWIDCINCPKFPDCDEIAMTRGL